ncbi:hypothetical protein [Streptomyces sp. MN13]
MNSLTHLGAILARGHLGERPVRLGLPISPKLHQHETDQNQLGQAAVLAAVRQAEDLITKAMEKAA